MAELNFSTTILIFLIAACSCNVSKQNQTGKATSTNLNDSVLVDRDGNRYPLRKLPDNKKWITTNLQLNIPGSFCYKDSSGNCDRYGRLYTWESAQKGCALLGDGWVLPSKDDWQQLTRLYGGNSKDSSEIRKNAFQQLLNTGNSTFNAVLGGGRAPDGVFARIEAHGFYWMATETDTNLAWYANFAKGSQSLYHQNDGEKLGAFSVRCIKNISGKN